MVKKITGLVVPLDLSKYPALAGQEEALEEVARQIHTEMYWKEGPVELLDGEGIRLVGGPAFHSFYLAEVFRNAARVSVVCVTLGRALPAYIQEKMGAGAFHMAALADAYGSACVEALAEKWMDLRRQEERPRGFHPTMRFSPGYGDFALEDQPKIIDWLGISNRVTVTESYLLDPEKTITFLAGWSKVPQDTAYPSQKPPAGGKRNPCPGGGNCRACTTTACDTLKK